MKRFVVLAVSAVIVAVLAMHISQARHVTPAVQQTQPPLSQLPHATQAVRQKTTPLLALKQPWRTGEPQKGIDVYFSSLLHTSRQQLQAAARQTFNYVVGLGANSVSISFPFNTAGLHGSRVYKTRATPSPQQISAVLEEANRQKLRVTLRPLMDETNLAAKGGWRGSIEPADPSLWFASYQRFLKPYLAVAKAQHAATFCIAAELNSLANDQHWTSLIRWAKTRFPGQLLYNANWNSMQGVVTQRVAFGVDAYFATSLSDNASLAEVTAAWNNWVKSGLKFHSQVVLSEVGIAAEPGAYLHPWWWGLPGKPIDLGVQQRWFTAACRSFRQNQLAGIYFWRVDLGQDLRELKSHSADHDTFVARPAATAIKQCFKG